MKKLKLKKLKNIIDICTKVRIWTQDDDDDTPSFEGLFMDIPWWLMDCRIGREDGSGEEPILFVAEKNQYDVYEPVMIIRVIEE